MNRYKVHIHYKDGYHNEHNDKTEEHITFQAADFRDALSVIDQDPQREQFEIISIKLVERGKVPFEVSSGICQS